MRSARCVPRSSKSVPVKEAETSACADHRLADELASLLRSRLSDRPCAGEPASDDGVEEGGVTPAAVLFALVLRAEGTTVLLTRRTDHLKDHPGQISFPGGRVEADDRSPAHTALREAEEEVGLPASRAKVVGYLPDYLTVTGFRVTPVVALVRPPFVVHPDPYEVAEVFEVPLAFLMDRRNHQLHSALHRGRVRSYLAMPYRDYFIWGATAGMIASLARTLENPRDCARDSAQ